MQPTLALFVDRPEAVGAGLAGEVGLPHAMRLQRMLVHRALAAAAEAGMAAAVWYRPPDARPLMRQWLGELVDLRPQGPGSLGARVGAAVAGSPLPAGWIALLRPVSGIDSGMLRGIVAALEEAPYLLGPASDGGCYLIAGRAPVFPALRRLESAGPGALAELRDALDAAHLRWRECAVLPPIETAAAARAARLLG